MSPMSTAAMNAVTEAKAGIASGVLSMFRMIGGTFGVAAIGALFQASARSRLDEQLAGSGITAGQRDDLAHQLGGGGKTVIAGLDPTQAKQVASAANDAFIEALAHSMRLSAAVAAAGAVLGAVLIRSRRGAPGERPEAAAASAPPTGEMATAHLDG
jgi:hypothetical protein